TRRSSDLFQQFMDVDDGILQTALDEAALYVDEDIWAVNDFITGTFYLAGHFVSVAQTTASSGGMSGQQITSQRIGQISVSYGSAIVAGSASTASGYPSLATTGFGLMFLALMRRNSA